MKKLFLINILLTLVIIAANAQRPKFELVWADEFNYSGLPDSTKWSYDVGGHGWGNNELQYYTSKRLENAHVGDGKLIITAIKEPFKNMNYTSARLVTAGKGDWLYGRFEIRAKLPKGRGTWPAIWMLSTDWTYGGWPESGEIDIMEHVGYDPDAIHFSTHCLDYYFKINTQKTSIMKANRTDTTFYTYTLEWTPDRIDGYINDSLYFTTTNERLSWKKWPFDKPFHIILNVAAGGFWGAAQGMDTTIWPQSMEVDYVRAYKLISAKDTVKPSSPTNLTSKPNFSRVALTWEPAYDNYAVKEYQILLNGKAVGKTLKHSFTVPDLQPSTKYSFSIIALDWEGNQSNALNGDYSTLDAKNFSIPGKVEAEDYIKEFGSEIEKSSDTLGGYNLCWLEPGDFVEYSIDIVKSGKFELTLRAATERKDAAVELYNQEGKLLTTCAINNTSSWRKWANNQSLAFELNKGVQKIKLKVIGDRMNLNWFEIK